MENKLNRLNILKFTIDILNQLESLQDMEAELEESEWLDSVPEVYKEEYRDLIEDFKKSSIKLADKVLENELLNADKIANCEKVVIDD